MRRRDLLVGAGALTAMAPFAGAARAQRAAVETVSAPLTRVLERGQLSLNDAWSFHEGDIPFPKVLGHEPSYANAKAGNAPGAASTEYDASEWPVLNLPHDWAIAHPADQNENLSQGYRPRGYAWYRRAFRLEPSQKGRYIEIQFEGISTNATVWLNGNLVTHSWSGYASIYIDATAMARYGADLNYIAIRVDAEKMEGWWYEGAGLYRHTWLIDRAPTHIITDGVSANPVQDPNGAWRVPVEATLYNILGAAADVEVVAELIDPDGRTVARAASPGRVGALEQAVVNLSLDVASPRLWSLETPTLYTVRTRLLQGGQEIDARVTRAGFRTIRFDPNEGFFLNGVATKIQGVCIHQDHAGVGVAVPAALVEWRVRQLKAMGCNAIRSSHNAPDIALLDACDKLGMMVMDENRLFNISPDYTAQLRWLVRRDRNRPSVIMWSVFNEEPIQSTPVGYEMVRRMSKEVKRLDVTRPVTAAMNGGLMSPVSVAKAVDLVGSNYQDAEFDRFHAQNPTVPLFSSEDTSAFMTRGEWTTDRAKHVMSSYDVNKAPWGDTHREAWQQIAERKFVAGGFVWTGFDYHGEPTPFAWPTKSSLFGILDLCGFPKMAFYLHQAKWIHDRPILSLAPHWNWPGKEGQKITVMALTNAERVRLSLNGKLVSEKAVDPYEMVSWDVPYAPGVLEAVGLVGGKIVSRTKVETTGAPVALRLTPYRTALAGDGRDATPVTVEALDAKGRPVPTANLPVSFTVEGLRIIGLGNGDPNSAELSKGDRTSLFNGLAQVILQTDAGSSGPARLAVASPGLKSASAALSITPAAVPSVAPAREAASISQWRQSPLSATRPDPTVQPARSDMNSWAWILAGTVPDLAAGSGFIVLNARYTPNKAVAARGGILNLSGVTGRAEVWISGALAGHKTDPGEGGLVVPLAPGAGERTVNVLIETTAGVRNGLSGVVTATPAG